MNHNFFIILLVITTFGACKSPEARKPVQNNSGSFISKSVERNKAIYENEEKLITQIIEKDSTHNYIASEEGFWYFYNKKDTLQDITPKFGDHIFFKYDVKNLNGTEILSENETGIQNYIVDKTNQKLIPGIRDGIKLMKEHEIITFLFPSYNAYGYYGIENKLGSNVPVQCTVTLIKINQTNENN